METTEHGWTVLDRDAGVLSLSYHFTEQGEANCFAARMANGEMLVVSPSTGLTDGQAADLEAFGKVGAIVASNGFHHLGQSEWRARYPEARHFAPTGAGERIRAKSGHDFAFEPLSALAELTGDAVTVRDGPGSKCGESWAFARIEGGHAWFGSDIFCNWDKFPGNFALNFLWKFTKSGPGFKLFNLAMMAIVKDKKTLLRALLTDLEAHPPSVMVLGHGAHVHGDELANAVPLVRAATN